MKSSQQEFSRSLAAGEKRRRRILMKRLMLLLTGLQVFAHSVFGCCAHTEHTRADFTSAGCCHQAIDSAPCAPAHRHRACATHGHSASPVVAGGEKNSDPRPTHQCRHDSCQWIVQKDAAPAGDLIQLAYLPAYTEANCCATARPLTIAQPLNRLASALPVRLHLWVGVLLI